MDDLDVLARDFGFKANQTRSAQPDRRSTGDPLFNDVFGGQPMYASSSNAYTNHKQSPAGGFDYDSIFRSSTGFTSKNSNDNVKSSSIPVHDKPVYDADIFDGLPGLKSKPGGSTARLDDDVFASVSSPATGGGRNHSNGFDELLGNLGRKDKIGGKQRGSSAKSNLNSRGFDDLLAGLGSEQSDTNIRPIPESRWGSMPNAGSKHGNILNDPLIVLGSSSTPNSSSGRFTDPLEEIGKLNNSRSARFEASSGGGAFDNLNPLSTTGKSHSFSLGKDNGGKDESPAVKTSQSATTEEPRGSSSFRYSKGNVEEKAPADRFREPPISPIFDNVAKFSSKFQKSSSPTAFSPQYSETGRQVEPSSASEGVDNPFGDIWLVVSEVPLYTQPSTAPPPSRPPPPIPRRSGTSAFSSGSRKKGNGFSYPSSYVKGSQSPNQAKPAAKGRPVLQLDELEEFALGNDLGESTNLHSSVETNALSAAAASAAAMKDAMDKAEAKFRHAKEVREREHARSARNKESGQKGEDEQETQIRETQDRFEAERKQKEEEERERRRLEREKARQAVERATREARERAATEARERAAAEARMKAERTAVERANAEARERAERAAVQRAQAEARERAAAEAKERAEKVAAEARGRAAAESKEKELQDRAAVSKAEAEAKRRAERAAVDRAAAEARERAAARARERAASTAKMNQQKSDDDLESFFSMGRASSAPRPRTNTTDPLFEQQFQSKGGSDAAKRTPSASGATSSMKKTSSTTNFVDDLSSIFGAAPSGEFQEVEGESEERRKARLERHQRTQERAAKALEEKNQRDLQAQREQEERHRIAETLDIEIKRWAAGKEGNLRALLSTLQYVLWPECGWQPVSLTELISAASVKKVYRKATLCIHPDKVQQKGATLQQKYIAEKVFDLLKESWNRFNSEELF